MKYENNLNVVTSSIYVLDQAILKSVCSFTELAVELTELKLLVGVVKMKSFAICTLSKRVSEIRRHSHDDPSIS